MARVVLKGLQSEPLVDVCTQTVVGDFVAGAVSERPCTIFDNALNIVEAAAWAAVYFGPPGTFAPVEPAFNAHRQFKSALEDIAVDTDQKQHSTTIKAAKEALRQLDKMADKMKEGGVTK